MVCVVAYDRKAAELQIPAAVLVRRQVAEVGQTDAA